MHYHRLSDDTRLRGVTEEAEGGHAVLLLASIGVRCAGGTGRDGRVDEAE